MASNSGKVNREAGKPPRKKSPPELQKDDDASPSTRPAWQPAELCELRLPNGGTLTAIITGAETGRIAWHIDYRHGHTVQTIDGREEPSMEAARETAWEVMQIMCAALVEETGA